MKLHHLRIINDAMDAFEAGKVAKVMDTLDWKWYNLESPPDEYEIRQKARQLLEDCVERAYRRPNEDNYLGSGGIETYAHYYDDIDAIELHVKFVITTGEAWSKSLEENNEEELKLSDKFTATGL